MSTPIHYTPRTGKKPTIATVNHEPNKPVKFSAQVNLDGERGTALVTVETAYVAGVEPSAFDLVRSLHAVVHGICMRTAEHAHQVSAAADKEMADRDAVIAQLKATIAELNAHS